MAISTRLGVAILRDGGLDAMVKQEGSLHAWLDAVSHIGDTRRHIAKFIQHADEGKRSIDRTSLRSISWVRQQNLRSFSATERAPLR